MEMPYGFDTVEELVEKILASEIAVSKCGDRALSALYQLRYRHNKSAIIRCVEATFNNVVYEIKLEG